MKIVIDIPNEKYKRLPYIDQFSLREYIENGTPLPKGHGRLIDADKLHYVKMLVQNPNNGKHRHIVAVRASEINKAPTIIEADGGDAE